jgi:hypothetical protein
MITPADKSLVREFLPHCGWARVISNYTAGHPPSSIRFAKTMSNDGSHFAFLLANGSDRLQIMARPNDAEEMFQEACRVCPDWPWVDA